MFCWYCGQRLSEGSHFCSACGKRFSDREHGEASPVTEAPLRKRGGIERAATWKIVFAASAAGLLLVAGWLYYNYVYRVEVIANAIIANVDDEFILRALDQYDEATDGRGWRSARIREKVGVMLTERVERKANVYLNAKVADYGDAWHYMDVMKQFSVISEMAYEKRSLIFDVKQARDAWYEAESLRQQHKYFEALASYASVALKESGFYDAARQAEKDLHETMYTHYMDYGQTLFEENQFEEAWKTLIRLGHHYEDTEELKAARKKYSIAYYEQTLNLATDLASDLSFADAIEVLEDALDDFGNHGGVSDLLAEIKSRQRDERGY